MSLLSIQFTVVPAELADTHAAQQQTTDQAPQRAEVFVLSKQVLRSGTAIGALVREAEHAESKADFSHKMNIALKEANVTLYWLELLHQAEYNTHKSFESIRSDSEELLKILGSIVKTSKAR